MDSDERSSVFRKIENYLVADGVKPGCVTEVARIYHDLGYRGIDAWNLMGFAKNEYDIDFTGFNFRKFFHDEYFGLMDVYRALFRIYDKSKMPFPVSHLVDICIEKKWRDPPVQPQARFDVKCG